MARAAVVAGIFVCALAAGGCQKPTDPDSTVQYDEAIDVTSAPDPIVADTATGGRTYRVVRGNNQPDDILPYDWHAIFSATVVFNSKANDKDLDIDFPVKLSAATLVVKQASAGIITPPTGGDKEYYDFVTLGASSNQVSAINTPTTLSFEIWYDLPSLRKEAVITVTFTFIDDDGGTFQRAVDFRVAP
jgi:hypothetical protein